MNNSARVGEPPGCVIAICCIIGFVMFFAGIVAGHGDFDFNTYECTKICPNMGESIRYRAECYCKTTGIETP